VARTTYPSRAPELTSVFFFGGVRVAHLFKLWPFMGLYVLSSVLWYPLRFPHKEGVRFVFTFSCL